MNKNAYKQLKDKHQKEMNAFPLGAAFSDKQFEEMMQKWGLTVNDADKICSIGGGCFIRKSDKAAFFEMLDRFKKEREDAIAADKTGMVYIYDRFLSELANHENCITYDYEETFDARELTFEKVNADQRLVRGLQKALKDYLKNANDY